MDILEHIVSVFSDFTDPKKRVFFGYLLISAIIGLIWLIIVKRLSPTKAILRFADKKVFFSASSVTDYKIFVINRLFSFLISPLLITQLVIATAIFYWLHEVGFVRSGALGHVDTWIVVALFSAVMFVLDDFTKYLVHRWMHKWPLLWAIHKTHHSATTLTPVTVYRIHPLEGVLYALRSAFAQGVAISTFIYLFGDQVDLYTIVGVNVLVFVFHITGSNLRHSHIHIGYWPWLERVFISPAQHQIHHSIAEEHYDKNFGAALAIWDWMFGSLHLSEADRDVEFGLEPGERSDVTGLRSIYLRPVVEIGEIILARFQSILALVKTLFTHFLSAFRRARVRKKIN